MIDISIEDLENADCEIRRPIHYTEDELLVIFAIFEICVLCFSQRTNK